MPNAIAYIVAYSPRNCIRTVPNTGPDRRAPCGLRFQISSESM